MANGVPVIIKKLGYLTPAGVAAGPWRRMGLLPSLGFQLAGLLIFWIGLAMIYPDDMMDINIDTAEELAIFGIGLLALFLFIQLCYLLAAMITMCWGAGVEPWRKSLGRTLSRWYQLTPWLAVMILAFIGTMEGIDELDDIYWDNYSRYSFNGIDQDPIYVLEQERFWFLLQFLRTSTVSVFFALGLWMIFVALAVSRDKPRFYPTCRWPACCETCGYALAGLEDDQPCPECGRITSESKHTNRSAIKTPAFHLLYGALIQPSALGKRLLTRRYTTKPVRVLLWSLLLVAISTPAGIFIIQLAADELHWIEGVLDFIEQFILLGLMAGVMIACLAAFVTLLAGSIVATTARIFGKRNAMLASCKAACLASGFLPVWLTGNFVVVAILMKLEDLVEQIIPYADYEVLMFLAWLSFSLLMLLLYLFIVGRIEHTSRYANE